MSISPEVAVTFDGIIRSIARLEAVHSIGELCELRDCLRDAVTHSNEYTTDLDNALLMAWVNNITHRINESE